MQQSMVDGAPELLLRRHFAQLSALPGQAHRAPRRAGAPGVWTAVTQEQCYGLPCKFNFHGSWCSQGA